MSERQRGLTDFEWAEIRTRAEMEVPRSRQLRGWPTQQIEAVWAMLRSQQDEINELRAELQALNEWRIKDARARARARMRTQTQTQREKPGGTGS